MFSGAYKDNWQNQVDESDLERRLIGENKLRKTGEERMNGVTGDLSRPPQCRLWETGGEFRVLKKLESQTPTRSVAEDN